MAESRPERMEDKAEESLSLKDLPASRFRSLTRRLLKVSRDEVAEQEELYQIKKGEAEDS